MTSTGTAFSASAPARARSDGHLLGEADREHDVGDDRRGVRQDADDLRRQAERVDPQRNAAASLGCTRRPQRVSAGVIRCRARIGADD